MSTHMRLGNGGLCGPLRIFLLPMYIFLSLPPTSAKGAIRQNKNYILCSTCSTRFTTQYSSSTLPSLQMRTSVSVLKAWRRKSPKQDTACITHHMFSTFLVTHASWVLAHRAHHSAQMYTVPQLIRSPGWEPDGIWGNLLRMIIYKQLCSKIMHFFVIFLN